MLVGEFIGKLTEKNRIALPKKFRDELKGDLIITRGYEDCLILIDETRWKKLLNILERKPLFNKNVRDTMRFIVGGASEISMDSQGRFILPSNLIDYATISKEVVFMGIVDWLEIWDLQKWNSKLNELKLSASEIADRLVETKSNE